MKWFKIKDRNFTADQISVQYTIEEATTHLNKTIYIPQKTRTCDITVLMTITNNQDYDFMYNIYDNHYTPNSKFEIVCGDFKAFGCLIRTLTSNLNNVLEISFIADHIQSKDLSEKRNEIIEEILNQTSK